MSNLQTYYHFAILAGANRIARIIIPNVFLVRAVLNFLCLENFYLSSRGYRNWYIFILVGWCYIFVDVFFIQYYNMVCSALYLPRALYTVYYTNIMLSRKPSFVITPALIIYHCKSLFYYVRH